MSVINTITMIVDNLGNDIFDEVTVVDENVEKNPPINRGNSNANLIQVITPIDTSYTRDITFLLNNGRTVEYLSLENEGKVTVEYQGTEQEWNKYTYGIQANVLSVVALLTSSPLYYSCRFREIDPDYLGLHTTTFSVVDDTDEASISAELLATSGFDSPSDGEFVTVYNATEDESVTYQYDSIALAYEYLGYLRSPYAQIVNTYQQELTVNPTVQGVDTTISTSELDIIKQWLTDLEQDIDDILLSLKQTTDGVFEVTNDDAWSSDKRLYNYLIGTYTQLGLNYIFGDIDLDLIDFNPSGTGGEVSWNNTEMTTDRVINSNVTVQDGRELLKLGRNTSGVTITNGSVVAIIGSVGNVAEIELVDVSDPNQSFKVIGVATEDIADNSVGNVTLIGRIRGLDTSAWAEGTILYASETSGELTDTCPAKPNRCILMAVVETSNAGSGVIWCWPRPIAHLGELSDVYEASKFDKAFPVYNETNSRYEMENLEEYTFVKTGWPVDMTDKVTSSLSGTTFSTTFSEDVTYYIQNVEYTISAGTYDVTISNGTNFIYLTGDSSTITVSPTVWNIRNADKALMWEVNYNSTLGICVNCAYEFHSYEMSPVDHYHGHFTDATTVVSGLSVSPSASLPSVLGTLEVTQGKLMDEDIVIQILNGTLGTAKFTQELSTLKAYKYWRTGTGTLNKSDYDTNVALLVGGIPQLNPESGGTYSLVDMTNNRYGAMWIVYTTDTESPVQLWVGQQEADTLNDALELNGLDSMNFGSIPVEEIRVAYRCMIRRVGSSYTLYQVDNFLTDPQTGLPTNPATSHGSLSGLLDDDHTQYYNDTRLALTNSAGKVGFDNSIKSLLLATDVQDAIDENSQAITDIIGGAVADNSITDAKLGTDVKVGSNSTYQTNTGSSANDVYEAIEEVYVKLDNTPSTKTYDISIDSTAGDITPINGLAVFNELKGLSATQLLTDGDDFATSWTIASASGSVTDGVYSFTASSVNGRINQTNLNLIASQNYFIVGRVKADSTDVRLVLSDGISSDVQASHSGSGEYEIISAIGSLVNSVSNGNYQVRDFRTSGWTQIDVDWVMAFPIPDVLSSKTASELNDIFTTYFEDTQDISDWTLTSIKKNLFDFMDYSNSNVKWTGTGSQLETLNSSAGISEYGQITLGNGQYTLNANLVTASNFRIQLGSIISGTTIVDSGYVTAPYTFTIDEGEQTYYIKLFTNTANGIFDQVQIEEGSTATNYQAYESETITFKTQDEETINLRSVSTIRDRIYRDNNAYYLEQNVGYDFNDVVQSATTWNVITVGNVYRFSKNLSTSLDYKTVATSEVANVSLKVNGDLYIPKSLNDISTASAGYYVTTRDTDSSVYIALPQSTGINTTALFEAYLQANDVTFYYELNDNITTEIDADGNVAQDNPTTLIQSTDFATEYEVTFSLDIANQVVQTEQRQSRMEKDIKRVETVADTNKDTLDNQRTLLFSGNGVVRSDATKGTDITLTDDFTNYDALQVHASYIGFTTDQTEVFTLVPDGSNLENWISFRRNVTTTFDAQLTFQIENNSSTTDISLYNGSRIDHTFSTNSVTVSAETSLRVKAVYGLKY